MAREKGDTIRRKTLKVWWEEKTARNPDVFHEFTYEQLVAMFESVRMTDVMIGELIGRNRNATALLRHIYMEEKTANGKDEL